MRIKSIPAISAALNFKPTDFVAADGATLTEVVITDPIGSDLRSTYLRAVHSYCIRRDYTGAPGSVVFLDGKLNIQRPPTIPADATAKALNRALAALHTGVTLIDHKQMIFRHGEFGCVPFPDLSDGMRNLIWQIHYLITTPLNNSVIFIEEPDSGKHPAVQLALVDFYRSVGKDNQIIMASASPHILSTVQQGGVFRIESGDTSWIARGVVRVDKCTHGAEPDHTLLCTLGMDEVRDTHVQAEIQELAEKLRLDPYGWDTLVLREKLRDTLGNGDRFVITAEHKALVLNGEYWKDGVRTFNNKLIAAMLEVSRNYAAIGVGENIPQIGAALTKLATLNKTLSAALWYIGLHPADHEKQLMEAREVVVVVVEAEIALDDSCMYYVTALPRFSNNMKAAIDACLTRDMSGKIAALYRLKDATDGPQYSIEERARWAPFLEAIDTLTEETRVILLEMPHRCTNPKNTTSTNTTKQG